MPGIYDAVAKLIIKLACAEAGTDPRDVLQCLDDVVGMADKNSEDCWSFYKAYRRVCAEVRVKLAPEGDKEKAFPPDECGVVLGIEYDTCSWSWRIPYVKATYILEGLYKVIDGNISNQEVQKLSGRLTHYHPLVPGGRSERFWINRLGDSSKPGSLMITPDKLARSQAVWWSHNLRLSLNWTMIPDLRGLHPAKYLALFPDAAGGSDTNKRLGLGGCVMIETGRVPWCYLPWPNIIRHDMENDLGQSFARRLYILEGLAALALLCSEPDLVRGKAVRIFSDNTGYVAGQNKGSSSCEYLMTVIMATEAVARALDIQLRVCWSPRRSGTGENVADDLSKGDFASAREELPRFRLDPSEIPRSLVKWINHPRPSRLLGQAIIEEISQHSQVLRWNLERPEEVEDLKVTRKRKLWRITNDNNV